MITPKIKALFQFIEFLHSNIENFKQYDETINEIHLLDKERQKVSPKKTFKDKLKYDEVQEQIEDKFNIIQENILQPIRTKVTELNICDLNKIETLENWNNTDIHILKECFSKDDLPEIFSHKNKYLEYRTETKGETFSGLRLFFEDLDKVLKPLFDFFKETEQNEFEAFETKAVQVNSIAEARQGIKKGQTEFTLPDNFLNPSTIQKQTNIEPLPAPEVDTVDTKADVLYPKLKEYGFFEIEKVKELNPEKQSKLVKLIANNSLPYQIAMLEFFGFIKYLHKNYFDSQSEVNKGLSKILDTNERAVRGNRSVLNRGTKEDKSRYTSHQYTDQVQSDYNNL